jgi:MmgE/PrpD N-terminal domain
VALTIAEYVGGSGRDLMLAVALGYTVQSRFVDHANFMSGGFDHTAQLAFSHNAAAGRLLGLSEQQIGHAKAMAAVSDASFAVVRAKPLSQWKGLASSQSALGAINALFLARRGVQGPLQVIEGPLGINHLLRMRINIDWDKQGYEGVVESTIKKYNSMIHTQSPREWTARKSWSLPRLFPRNHASLEAGDDAVGNGLVDARPAANTCLPHGVLPPSLVAVLFSCRAHRHVPHMPDATWRTRGVASARRGGSPNLGMKRSGNGKGEAQRRAAQA